MLQTIPQLSTGTDIVKSLHLIKIDNPHVEKNKINTNFYMCLDIPEGNISEQISEKSLLTQDNEEKQPLSQTTIKTQKQSIT